MEILNAFENTYSEALANPKVLNARIQLVKDALYRRSYEEAFNSKNKLESYVVRWSPARALAYNHIFKSSEFIINMFKSKEADILCIGGGAGGEIAAFSSFTSRIHKITTLDVADWEPVVKLLANNLGIQNLDMLHANALDIVPQMDVSSIDLITCCFTTNELVAESRIKYMQMLNSLTRLKPGALFLAVESAGSYGDFQITEKKYPVHFLMQYCLVDKSKAFELVQKTDSEWFRLPPDLEYPYELQNMRYLLRLYRKL